MTSTPTRTEQAEVEAFVQSEMERWSVPGLALAVLHGDQVEAWGFGVCSLETRQPVTPDTLFQAGSISKVFTATLVMQLVDEGRLDLDTPVSRYLPGLRLADSQALGIITLRHLLSHTAGFYGDRFEDYGPGDDALAKAVAEFDSLRQYTPPGALWAYCNTGFQLAGYVIERVLGSGFEAAMRARVLTPLGLERTVYFAHEAITYPVAAGHNKLPGQDLEIARQWARPRARSPQGGVISTVGDLVAFARLHLDGGVAGETRVLSEASVTAMQQPQVEAGGFADAYGLGWALHRYDGGMVAGHGGSTNGFRAALSLAPDRRVAIAILTNGSLGAAAARGIETWALQRYAGLRRPDPPTSALPSQALARLAGRYERPDNMAVVTAVGDGLRVQITARDPFTKEETVQPAFPAAPVSATRFLITAGESAGETVDFITGDEGTVRFVRLHGRLADRIG